MISQPDDARDLDGQFAEIDAVLRGPWVPRDAGQLRVLTHDAYAEVLQSIKRGGLTSLDPATIEAVRGGAQPGDPLPPLQATPYIRGVTDTEVIITGTGQGRRVAVLFSYTGFPGVRFGHRFPPGLDGHGDPLYLMEEIETGALDRMMQTPPPADTHGITWTTWGDPVQEPE